MLLVVGLCGTKRTWFTAIVYCSLPSTTGLCGWSCLSVLLQHVPSPSSSAMGVHTPQHADVAECSAVLAVQGLRLLCTPLTQSTYI